MAALMDIVKKGSTDRSVTLRIVDSGDGTPETGVVYNTSGIDLWYRREGAAKVSITEATLSALTDAHSDGGFLHIGDGEYRLDLPDAAFATGANHVDIGGTVTGMIVIGGRVRLVNLDVEDTVPTAAAVADAVWDEARAGHVGAGSFGEGVKVESLNTQAQADVEAQVDGQIQANRLHELLLNTLGSAPTAGSLFGDLTEDDGGTQRFTANALELAPTDGTPPTAGAIADAVWDEARSGHTTAGSYGESFLGVVNGQAVTGTLSTTAFTTNLTEATDDHYNGRIVVWITGVLAGQATDIQDYNGTTKLVTVTAMTEAPSNTDRFVIV